MNFSRSFFPVLLMFSVFSISVLAAPPEGKGKPPKPPGDGGDPTECSYPAFSDIPKDKLRGLEADFSHNYGGDRDQIENLPPVFDEDGSGTGNWLVEDMSDLQHRAGNKGISEGGVACGENCTPIGKRYSAWYNYNTGLFDYVGDNLRLGGKIEPSPPPDYTRPPEGGMNPSDPDYNKWYRNRLYTTWLSTLQRESEIFGSNPKPGSQTFKPPMYLKTRVNFENMQTPGFRLSMWLMPRELGTDVSPTAYNGNFDDGFEMDIFEFEPISVIRNEEDPSLDEVCGNIIEFAWINSFATKGKSAKNASGKNHFEGLEEGYCPPEPEPCDLFYADPNGRMPFINEGWHDIEFLWVLDHNGTGEPRIVWAFNNEIVLEITDPAKMPNPGREHYLIVSREMTNGLTSGDDIFKEGDTEFLPPEPGLYGWNGNSNLGEYFDKINADWALIDYIEIRGNTVNH